MKRKILVILLVLGLAAIVSAQTTSQGTERGQKSHRHPAADPVTVSGSLIVSHGMPALQNGDVTYIVGGINRLSGFVDGLKEGAQVTIEGKAITSPRNDNLKFLRPSSLSLGGKTYDMTPLLPPGALRHVRQDMMNRSRQWQQPQQQQPYAPQGGGQRQFR